MNTSTPFASIEADILLIRRWMMAILIPLLTALFSCTSPTVKPEDPALNQTNSGTIYVYRVKSLVGAGEKYLVYSDADLIGTLSSGGTFIRRIPTGQISINIKRNSLGVPTVGEKHFTFQVEAGEEYYLRTETSLSGVFFVGSTVSATRGVDVSLVTRQQWQEEQEGIKK